MIDMFSESTVGAEVFVSPDDTVLSMTQGHRLVSTEPVECHYALQAAADLIGYRSMAVATSDLAAKGAAPGWAEVSLVAPTLSREWRTLFVAGVARAALDFGLKVVGRNLGSGPQSVTVTVQVHGHVPAGQAIQPSGTKDGDGVYVTGTLGGAGLAPADAELTTIGLPNLMADSLLHRYWKPTPRLKFAESLRTIATAAINVSGGLTVALTRLCDASAVCCHVDLDKVPLFPGAVALQAVTAGGDYELAFTASPTNETTLHALAHRTDVPVSCIGTAYAGSPPATRWFSQGEAIQAPAGS